MSFPFFVVGRVKQAVVTQCVQKVGEEGGVLRIPDFDMELEIPRGAIASGQTRVITFGVILDFPDFVNNDDHKQFCFGINMSPSELRFESAVTVTLPHCAVLHRPSHVKAVLYSGKGDYTRGSKS